MVEVFKTNVQHRQPAKQLVSILRNQFAFSKISFDLEDCDKILRVEGNEICVDKIIGILKAHRFECEVLT